MKTHEKKIKCELYNDSMQGWKCYPIQQGKNYYILGIERIEEADDGME